METEAELSRGSGQAPRGIFKHVGLGLSKWLLWERLFHAPSCPHPVSDARTRGSWERTRHRPSSGPRESGRLVHEPASTGHLQECDVCEFKQTNKQTKSPHNNCVVEFTFLSGRAEKGPCLTRGEEDGASPRPSTARCPYAPTGLSPPLKGLPGCLSGLGACS